MAAFVKPFVALQRGDCLDIMAAIPASTIDLIAADLPYGSTVLEWDQRIPMEPLWDEFRRVLKPTGTAVLNAKQPFSSALVSAAPDLFKYSLVWEMTRATGYLHSANRPLCGHEDILVFSKGVVGKSARRMTYNDNSEANGVRVAKGHTTRAYGKTSAGGELYQSRRNCSQTILRVPNVVRPSHPTQKPLALMEWLIRTYSHPCDLILDPTMGSGTTIVAALNAGRDAIGIERCPDNFAAAKARIAAASSLDRAA